MPEPLYLTLDCSTTAAKAVVFDDSGREVAAAPRPLDLRAPRPGWAEQDPEQWWTASADALREAAAQVDAGRIAAVCLTHQRESFVCLDADGRALRPAILWMDTRAADEIDEFGTDEVARLSGKPADVTPSLYKLIWLTRHQPDALRDAARVGDTHAVLAHRLTGRWATAVGSADALGLFDLARATWSDRLLELAGVTRSQLPDLVPSGERIATLDDAVAADLGLPAGLPLVAGIGDGQAAALGTNALAAGTAYLNLGTSMVMGSTVDTYTADPAFRTLAAAEPGTYVLETLLNAAGFLITWFRREFGGGDELEPAARAAGPGADGLLTLPYWNAVQPPYWDPRARGATVGWHGSHTRAHLYRSILEGVAYELRLQLDGLPHRVDELFAVGGGTRSELWTQIVADVTGRPLVLQEGRELSAKGAAVLAAAHHTGTSIRDTAARFATPGGRVEPDPAVRAVYDDASARYRRLYPALRNIV